jgi:hypothetical protein
MVRVMKPKTPVANITQAEMEKIMNKKEKDLDLENSEDDEGDNEEDFDEDEGDNESPDPDEGYFTPPAPQKRVRKPKEAQEDDIFEFCEKTYVNKGIPIRYEIRKNGYFAGELEHPCSWRIIQENYGGGLFAIKAKHGHNSQIVKRQSISISQPSSPYQPNKPAQEQENMGIPQGQPQVIERIIEREAPSQPINYLEMFGVIQKMQETSQHSIKEAQKESQNSQNTLMAALLQMATNKPAPQTSSDDKIMALMMQMQQNSNQMFEKMMENTQRSIEAVQKNTDKMMEKMTERIEKMGDGGNGLKYSPEQIMQLMMQGQQRGFDMWQGLDKMADMKAAQRMEMLEATKETAVEESRPKSMTEKLIDTMLPVVASAIQAQAMSVAQQQQHPKGILSHPSDARAPVQPRPKPAQQAKHPQLPPPVAPKPRPKPPVQPAQPVKPASPTQPVKPNAPAQPITPTKPELKNVTPPIKTKTVDGFPSVGDEEVSTIDQDNLLAVEAEQKFVQYMNFAAITLTEGYTSQKPIPDTANALIDSLKPQRITLVDFLRTCPLDKVIETMKTYGVDETVSTFVREVYAYLEAATLNESGGSGFTAN